MDETERKYHEVANLFPLMQGGEFEELKHDISTNGLLESIWLDSEGAIIDGRNRHRACIETGTQPQFRTWVGSGSLVGFVVSLNLHRRHLSSGQRAALAVDLLPMLEAEAKERMETGANQYSPVEIIPHPSRNGKSRDKAADIMGTNNRYVQDAKKIKETEPELFERVKSGETTIPKAMQTIRRAERVEAIQEISSSNGHLEIDTLYPVIYADPPWEYDYSKSDSRRIDNHYPTMPIEDICNLEIPATEDAILFLWATNPKLKEALLVIESWGFNYLTNMVWTKDKIGMGYYARQQHELLLIAKRGTIPVPLPANRPNSHVHATRDAHSKKPALFYEVIEAMYPEYAKIELFSRNQREGWEAWGNQAK